MIMAIGSQNKCSQCTPATVARGICIFQGRGEGDFAKEEVSESTCWSWKNILINQ